MNTVPLIVLTKALAALKAAHAKLLDRDAPDPYLVVLRAEQDLEHYVEQILKNTPMEVTK